MQAAALLACLALVAALALGQLPPQPTSVQWFTQQVNHFDLGDTRTFQQQILLYDGYWDAAADGPLLVYTGNEGPIGYFYNNTGFVFELAQQFGGLVVFIEHRYYGASTPFGVEDSYTQENIAYLSVEQALADYGSAVLALKADLGAEAASVMAFGGSYGGMLAAWFRLKYPNVVDMALAASAPILMGSSLPPTTGFYEAVTNDFAAVDAKCPDAYRAGFAEAVRLLNSGPVGLQALSNAFDLCTPLEADQADLFLGWAITGFASLAMADYPYPTCFLGCLPAWPLSVACNNMLAAASPFEGLVQTVQMIYGASYSCFNISNEFVPCSDQTGCGLGPSAWAWSYQACTEILYFPATNNVTDMFPPRPWDLANVTAYCQARWNVTPRIGWTSLSLGGADIEWGSRIIFSNGMLDPWHGGGFMQSLSDSLIAVHLVDGAHHLDLRSSNPLDPPSVSEARAKEANILRKWLDEVSLEKAQRARRRQR